MESQFGACAVRITKLKADGTPNYGDASSQVCIVGGVNKFKHDYEIEKGKEIYETDACGNPFVVFKLPDVAKWATFELTLGRFDDRLPELMGIGDKVVAGSTIIGHTVKAAAGCSVTANNPVCVELWRKRYDCGTLMDPPYKRVVLPLCTLTPQGFDSADSVALPVFAGISQANGNFADGPNNDLDDLASLDDWVYAEVLDDDYCAEPDPFTYTTLPANLPT